ncbi:MAG: GyrI-like domain-containing protein [Euryarchaeota archaeon]|nr:GyrI-like domain-containing protein [Euryarchaeota archaeon]
MQIEEKMVEEKQVTYIFATGPYDQLPALFGEVVGWVMMKGLQIVGPPFGIYYNSPEEVSPEELIYEVGIPFVGEAQEEGKIKIKKIPAQLVLSAMHKGPYDKVGPVFAALAEYAFKNGYEIVGAPTEIYLSDPNEVPESELLTEVQFPVVKK